MKYTVKIDEKKNPEIYWGLRVALPYNAIGIAFGILVRMDQFPQDIGDVGTAILFIFVPVAAQIIDYTGNDYASMALLIVSLLSTFFISWVIFSPIVGLFRGILGLQD